MSELAALLGHIERIRAACAAADYAAADSAWADYDRALRSAHDRDPAAWTTLQAAHQQLLAELEAERLEAQQFLQGLRHGLRSRQAYLVGGSAG